MRANSELDPYFDAYGCSDRGCWSDYATAFACVVRSYYKLRMLPRPTGTDADAPLDHRQLHANCAGQHLSLDVGGHAPSTRDRLEQYGVIITRTPPLLSAWRRASRN